MCCRSGAVCCWHYGFCWLLICLYTSSKAAPCSLCSLPCKMQGSSVQWHPKVCWVRANHSAHVLQNECWPLGLMLMLPAALRFMPGCFMFSMRRQCFSLLLHCWRDHVCSAFAAHWVFEKGCICCRHTCTSCLSVLFFLHVHTHTHAVGIAFLADNQRSRKQCSGCHALSHEMECTFNMHCALLNRSHFLLVLLVWN